MLMRRCWSTGAAPCGVVRRLVPRPPGADPADQRGRPRGPARTTRTTRSPPACSSTPSRAAGRSSPRRSRTPSSCSAAAPGSSCRSATRRRSPTSSAASSTTPSSLEPMAAECRRLAPELSWPAVAGRYDDLADRSLLAAAVQRVNDAEPSLRAHRGDERRHRHVRARRPRRARVGRGVLHRRHGPACSSPSAASRGADANRRRARPHGLPLPGRRPGRRRASPQPAVGRRSLAWTARCRGLLGPRDVGVRHGRSDGRRRTGCARARRRRSTAGCSSGRTGPGRWRSPRSVPPRCSPSTRATIRRAPPARRRRRRRRPARPPTRLDVAGGPADLRQRRPRRGAHRRRRAARAARLSRRRPRRAALVARPRDARRPPVADRCRRSRPATTSRRCSTSSRSRPRRWPTPAHGRSPSPATTTGATASNAASGGSSAPTTSAPVWRPRPRRRLRRTRARRRQPQPGHRVDPRADHHAAARSHAGARGSVMSDRLATPPVRCDWRPIRRASSVSCSCRVTPSPASATDGRRASSPTSSGWTTATSSTALDDIVERFGARHRDLDAMFDTTPSASPTGSRRTSSCRAQRRLLLGATFTQEYAVEAAAVCNPTAVAAPDQRGLATGRAARRAQRPPDRRGPPLVDRLPHRRPRRRRRGLDRPTRARSRPPARSRTSTARRRTFQDLPPTDADAVAVGARRPGATLHAQRAAARLHQLEAQQRHPPRRSATVRRLRRAGRPALRACGSRRRPSRRARPHPATEAESNGLEDARFVRFVDDDGTVTYYATYTAYDGSAIAQQLLADHRLRRLHLLPAARRRPQPTRAWRCSRDGSAAATTPCPAATASDERRRHVRRPRHLADGAPLDVDRPGWSSSSSATADHRSSSTRAGSCSPTASARCAPTRSARSSSTSTTRRRHRPDRAAAARPAARRAGRLRPQRRLLLRGAPPRRPVARPVRHRRRPDRLRHVLHRRHRRHDGRASTATTSSQHGKKDRCLIQRRSRTPISGHTTSRPDGMQTRRCHRCSGPHDASLLLGFTATRRSHPRPRSQAGRPRVATGRSRLRGDPPIGSPGRSPLHHGADTGRVVWPSRFAAHFDPVSEQDDCWRCEELRLAS